MIYKTWFAKEGIEDIMKLTKFYIICFLLFATGLVQADWQDIIFSSNATIQDGEQYVRVFTNSNANVAILGGQGFFVLTMAGYTFLTEKLLKNTSEGLCFNGKPDIVLEIRLSIASEQGYTGYTGNPSGLKGTAKCICNI